MQKILVLNFGGQYDQLIARRVRECGVYCEIHPHTMTLEEIRSFAPIGIIFTGGPKSVYAENSCHPADGIFDMGIPILGICYGCQLIAYHLGGVVAPAKESSTGEYGKTVTEFDSTCLLFRGLPQRCITWMSHGDSVTQLPQDYSNLARSVNGVTAAIGSDKAKIYGVQFHPEVNHTENGTLIIRNFLYELCGAAGDWTMEDYLRRSIEDIRQRVGNGKVLLALSGGVDSSVCAALMAEAIGSQLICVFVDHGFLRKDEGDEVENAFKKWDIRFIRVNAQQRFLDKLAGVSEPEEKRKRIGEEFIRVFEAESARLGEIDYLAQGTIYPDVIESGQGNAETIKSHHNVGGLPDHLNFKEIVEPLRCLFKDEVRSLGVALGLPKALVSRQPFPGPGLAIRIIGEITQEKLDILRQADFIFREEISRARLDGALNQYFAALTNMRSVGVMGDGRTYDYAIALRAVTTEDFMTADWARIPYDVLESASCRIVNEVPGVNRVLYDITSKPPATVEFE